jgi:hypothetical protein
VTADLPRRAPRWLVVVAGGLFVVACGLLPGSGPAVHIDNMTNTPMAVHVNGVWAGTYAPGASADVPLGAHGAPPYMVTVHSPSGNSLLQLQVTADDVRETAGGGGMSAGTTGIPCGELRISFGRIDQPPGAVPLDGLPACP